MYSRIFVTLGETDGVEKHLERAKRGSRKCVSPVYLRKSSLREGWKTPETWRYSP